MTLRIESMYAFIAVDPDDDTEGVIGFTAPSGWIPMVGADMEMVEKLRPMAEGIARAHTQTVKLVHFTQREEVEVIGEAQAG